MIGAVVSWSVLQHKLKVAQLLALGIPSLESHWFESLIGKPGSAGNDAFGTVCSNFVGLLVSVEFVWLGENSGGLKHQRRI